MKKDKKLENIKKNIETLGLKIEKIFELHEKGQIETERFNEFYNKPNEQIKQLKIKIPRLDGEIFALELSIFVQSLVI